MIYFDNAASTPMTEGVKRVFSESLELFANPSSLHRLGFDAEKEMKKARARVAATLSAREDEIVFTSGGTEADNLAVLGAAEKMRRRGNRILSTDSEHPAVEMCLKKLEGEGFEVIRLSTKKGALSEEEIEEAANEKTVLAAVMRTNNETGAVYDVPALSRIVKRKNPDCLVFSDCVQAYGKERISPARLGADLVSISSHKIHGPKGIGALYVKKGLSLPPLLLGGGQERGLRSGTENLPAILAFGEACREADLALDEARDQMKAIREAILSVLSEEKRVRANLPPAASDSILSLQVDAFPSEVLLHMLSQREIFVSSGSACSSHSGKSGVLSAFGLSSRERDHTVRLSFSRLNTVEEGITFASALKEILG